MKRMSKFVAVLAARAISCVLAMVGLLGGASTAAWAAEPAALTGTTQAATPLFDLLDANKDHVLSRQEFQSGYAGLQRLITVQVRLRDQFDALDANRNGAVDASEYGKLELIRRLGAAAPSLAAFDDDHDQKLGFSEYSTLVRTLTARQAPARK